MKFTTQSVKNRLSFFMTWGLGGVIKDAMWLYLLKIGARLETFL